MGNLLNQRPDVCWDGEIYYRHGDHESAASIPGFVCKEGERILRSRMPLAGRRFYGFEVQTHLLNPFEGVLPEYLELLEHHGFTHFAVLERRNYLRKTLSSLIALSTGRYYQPNSEKPGLKPVCLDMDNIAIKGDKKPLFSYFEEWDHQYSVLDGALANYQNVLRLTYEDDIVADPRKGYRLVCDFLDLKPYEKVSIRDQRANPFTLQEMIINYDEVRSAFEGTRFEWMLHETDVIRRESDRF